MRPRRGPVTAGEDAGGVTRQRGVRDVRWGSVMKPKLKVWVTCGEDLKFGDGRALLLEAIEERGSHKQPAQAFDRSYRNAWGCQRGREHGGGGMVWRLGVLITKNHDELAKLESLCTGKTMFDSGKVEIPFAADVFRYFAGWATKIHGETLAIRPGAFTFTLRQPVGVVGAIVPWNFPFLLSSWKLAPALAAGNTIVLKPPSQTPLTALKFAELCRDAGG